MCCSTRAAFFGRRKSRPPHPSAGEKNGPPACSASRPTCRLRVSAPGGANLYVLSGERLRINGARAVCAGRFYVSTQREPPRSYAGVDLRVYVARLGVRGVYYFARCRAVRSFASPGLSFGAPVGVLRARPAAQASCAFCPARRLGAVRNCGALFPFLAGPASRASRQLRASALGAIIVRSPPYA